MPYVVTDGKSMEPYFAERHPAAIKVREIILNLLFMRHSKPVLNHEAKTYCFLPNDLARLANHYYNLVEKGFYWYPNAGTL